jgi:cation:H+ antiporter
MKNLLFLLVGFIFLIKGADLFVEGSSSIAKKFKIPSMIIGLTIVAMGTSAPEASVSVTSSLIGQNDMSVANAVGSNFFNILVVLGVSTLFSKLPVKESTIKDDVPFLIFISIVTLIFGIDFNITRLEGVIFLGLFIWFILSLIKQAKQNKENEDTVNELPMSKTVFYIILGLAGIVLGGDITVDSASAIATQFGLSENLIGLTIVAVGTSLPEFVTSVIATRKGETEIAIGNVVGSNIFNILFVLGIAAVLSPMTISVEAGIDIIFMIFITILLFMNMKQEKFILKKHGIFYILLYLTYMVYTIIR